MNDHIAEVQYLFDQNQRNEGGGRVPTFVLLRLTAESDRWTGPMLHECFIAMAIWFRRAQEREKKAHPPEVNARYARNPSLRREASNRLEIKLKSRLIRGSGPYR